MIQRMPKFLLLLLCRRARRHRLHQCERNDDMAHEEKNDAKTTTGADKEKDADAQRKSETESGHGKLTQSSVMVRHLLLLVRHHPLSTIYIFVSKNHQSVISLCIITSSLESASCLIPPALHKTLSFLIHLPPARHSHPPSHVHYFIPGSKLTRNLFHHSLLAPTWTVFSDYTGPWTGLSRLDGFSFLVIFYLFWSCGRLSWLNCQRSSAR